jgi:hypothetical protein
VCRLLALSQVAIDACSVLLPGGADGQLIRPDGVAELDVRVTVRTDDGVFVLVKGFGLRHVPDAVMRRLAAGEPVPASNDPFREAMTFQAPAGPYAWLDRIVAIGTGERRTSPVHLEVCEVRLPARAARDALTGFVELS